MNRTVVAFFAAALAVVVSGPAAAQAMAPQGRNICDALSMVRCVQGACRTLYKRGCTGDGCRPADRRDAKFVIDFAKAEICVAGAREGTPCARKPGKFRVVGAGADWMALLVEEANSLTTIHLRENAGGASTRVRIFGDGSQAVLMLDVRCPKLK